MLHPSSVDAGLTSSLIPATDTVLMGRRRRGHPTAPTTTTSRSCTSSVLSNTLPTRRESDPHCLGSSMMHPYRSCSDYAVRDASMKWCSSPQQVVRCMMPSSRLARALLNHKPAHIYLAGTGEPQSVGEAVWENATARRGARVFQG